MFKLLALAGKPAGQISDEDLNEVASLIGGGENPALAEFFRLIRSAEPQTPVTELLRSPTAISMLQNLIERKKAQTDDENGEVFCRCPQCGFGFVTNLL